MNLRQWIRRILSNHTIFFGSYPRAAMMTQTARTSSTAPPHSTAPTADIALDAQ
jgi:hypothetical protein